MRMNTQIPMMGQPVNVLGAMAGGMELAGRQNEMQRQNALADLYRTQGAGIASGDQNALNALAAFDPMAAMDAQGARLRMDATRLGMDADRQRMSILSAQEERAAQEYAAGLSAAERQAEAAKIEQGVKMGMAARSPQEWDALMGQFAPDLVGAFDQRDMLANRFMTVAEIMKGRQGPEPTAGMREYEFARAQGFEGSFADWKKSGAPATNVNVNTGQPAPQIGTIPQGYAAVLDPANPSGFRLEAIPGGPAAAEMAAQQAKKAGRDELASRSGSIVLEDIGRAIEGIEGQSVVSPVTGPLGMVARQVPGTRAANVEALVSTVRSNIGFDRLQQMREASPTGGALGAVSDRELRELQAVLGSLDQSQSEEQLLYNLRRLETTYKGILQKASAYPNAAEFGFAEPQAEQAGPSDDDLLRMYGGE